MSRRKASTPENLPALRADPPHGPAALGAIAPGELALPTVRALDLYAALLADARKPATRRARAQDVADLAGFLGTPDPSTAAALVVAGSVGQANALATAYVRGMLDRQLAAATINRRVSTLRRLVDLARRFGVVDWSLDVDGLKASAYRDTSGPGKDGMARLLELVRDEATDPAGKRNRAAVVLLYTAGLRRTEAVSLDRGDLDLDGRRARVLGKGRHEREWLPFGAAAAGPLAEWLEAHPDPRPEAPLFVRLDKAADARPQRLTADGLRFILAGLGRRAGLSKPLAPHQLRHAAITRLAEATGGDMPRIQKFPRHSRLETVAIYVDHQREAARDLADLLGADLAG
jgi:integrase/recombinase XerC